MMRVSPSLTTFVVAYCLGTGLFDGLPAIMDVGVPCQAAEPADEAAVPTGKQKNAFDLKDYKAFVDHDLSRPKPACAMTDMGIPGRSVEGQLVDHLDRPLKGIAVAIVEPVGYSGHCYYENFDLTDEQGRFLVEGSVAKNRLVFRKPTGQIWKVDVSPEPKPIRVRWPQPAKVKVKVPEDVAGVGEVVTIQTRGYWAGMAVMRQQVEVDGDSNAVFESVVPGDYWVTARKAIQVAGAPKVGQIQVGGFSVAPGEDVVVECPNEGTVVHGRYDVEPNPVVGNLAVYVRIERERASYEDWPPSGDLVALDSSGSFRSRRLSPGNYMVKLMSKSLAPAGRFGGGGDRAIRSWPITVNDSGSPIDVDSLPPRDVTRQSIESILDSAAATVGRLRGERYAAQLKKLDDQASVIQTLLSMATDPGTPYRWRRVIPGILQTMTDSPVVVTGLLDSLDHAVDERERGELIRALQQSTQKVGTIVQQLTPYLENSNHITRSITVRVLGDLAVKHAEHAGTIAEHLQRALEDPWENTRNTAADYLGRIGSTDALPALRKASEDVDGRVAVMAAFSAWKVAGDPEYVYPTMTSVLHREGISGMWEAAYFMTIVAEQHPVPENTQGVLRRVATMAGKPPFRSTYEYEQSRAAKAAQKVLDQIAVADKP